MSDGWWTSSHILQFGKARARNIECAEQIPVGCLGGWFQSGDGCFRLFHVDICWSTRCGRLDARSLRRLGSGRSYRSPDRRHARIRWWSRFGKRLKAFGQQERCVLLHGHQHQQPCEDDDLPIESS